MKRTRMSTLLALATASMSAEPHTNLGTVARTKKLDDIGAKNAASVPTSLLAAGHQGHRHHAGARC